MSIPNLREGKMRALRADKGATETKLDTVDIPKLGPQDVLIKVKSAGLSPGPFTLLKLGRLRQLPTTFGHEVAGVVEKIGDLVHNVQIGQRVRLYPNLSCGSCIYCTTGRDQMCVQAAMIGFQCFGKGRVPLFEAYHEGGLAGYLRAPSWLIDVLPDNVSFDVGAKVHSLANAVRALKVAELQPASTVMITAPTGSMGTCCVKLAHFFGITRLILVGRSRERMEAVRKLTPIDCDIVDTGSLGDDWPTTNALATRLSQVVPQNGVDAILDFTSNGTDMYQVMASLAVGGTLVHMGGNTSPLPVPLIAAMTNCWRIIGTKNHSRAETRVVLDWLRDGLLKVDDLVTHSFDLQEVDEAVRALRERSSPIWWMVVHP